MATGHTQAEANARFRSIFRTDRRPLFRYCPDCANDFTMYGIARKFLLLASFVFIMAIMVPTTHSQSRLDVGLNDLKDRVVTLEKLPTEVASIQAKLDEMDKRERDRDDRNSNLFVALTAGIGLFILERVLTVVFGRKLRE